MNNFDIFIIVVVSFGLLRGFFRGFIKEVASIVGVVAGFYVSYTYYKPFASFLNQVVCKLGVGVINSWESYGNIVSFFILFVGILAITTIIAQIIKKFLKIVFLGWVDKLFGVIFGSLKGILFASVVFMVLTGILPNQPQFITQSTLAPYVVHISDMAVLFIPKDLKDNLKNKIERTKEIWKQQKSAMQQKITDQDNATKQGNSTGQENLIEKLKQSVSDQIKEKMTLPEE